MKLQVAERNVGGEFQDSAVGAVVEEVESLELPGKRLKYLQSSGLEATSWQLAVETYAGVEFQLYIEVISFRA